MKQKVLLVFGTRPEAIKMAPVVKAFLQRSDLFQTVIAVTGQHREMLEQVLNVFEIVPDYDLKIMKDGQDLFDVTDRVLMGMRDILKKVRPNLVLIHGDTTTSMATALAAFYCQIPVGHVEAGLRTNRIYSPWPEEMNRQITGRIASMHFAPTLLSRLNLLKEGVDKNKIVLTGNTVIDALRLAIDNIKYKEGVKKEIFQLLYNQGIPIKILADWSTKRKLVLITGHRRENFGNGFLNICSAIKILAIKYPFVDFVYPVHLNPNVKKPVYEILGNYGNQTFSNIFLIDPLDYLPFVYLMNKSYLVLTDSGGIQEEAPSLGKPVLVMRETTERPEAVDAGTVILVGTNQEKIINEVSSLIEDQLHYEIMSNASNPYGDGEASTRIVEYIQSI